MVSGHSPASSAQVGTTLCDLDTHLSVHWLHSHHVPKHDCCLHSEGGRQEDTRAVKLLDQGHRTWERCDSKALDHPTTLPPQMRSLMSGAQTSDLGCQDVCFPTLRRT